LLVKGMNEIAKLLVDLPNPALPIEDATMADGPLQMVLLAVGPADAGWFLAKVLARAEGHG
jgi:hypothetical protein